jgi:hypothetical protein
MYRCSADDENPAMHEGATGCSADRAMQGLGAGGLANDTPLGFIYSWGRTLRTIARAEIKKRKESGRNAFAEQVELQLWVNSDR